MSLQDDANAAAKAFACNSAAQLALLANPEAPQIIIDGVPSDPVAPGYTSPPGTHLFYNGPATCAVACADGSTTFFTTPPGRFAGSTQAQANAVAMSYACQQAQLGKLCLSNLAGEACLGQPAGFVVNATGAIGTGSWIQISGTLPPGLNAVGNNRQLLISGTPTTIGDYTFEFKCTLTSGISRTKTFSLKVMGITDTSLPGFSKNVPYSFQLTASGGTPPYSFALVSGFLPAGLHLSSSGLISGTPIVDFDSYPVGIAVNDGHVICRKDLSFVSLCVPAIVPALDAAYAGNFYQAAYANVTGKVWCISSATFTDLLEVSITGTTLHTVAIPGTTSIGCIFYDNTNELIYIAYDLLGNVWISSVNPTTRVIINSVDTGVLSGGNMPSVATYDPLRNKVWFGGQSTVFALTVSGFTVSSSPNTPDLFFGGVVYCSGSDVIMAMGNMNGTGNSAVTLIDPASFARTTIDINVDNGNTFGAVYCANNDRVYAPSAPGTKVFVINPSSVNGGTSIVVANQPIGGIYNSCTNRVQILGVSGGNAFCDYINPATSAVTHVGTIITYPFFVDPTNMFFDEDNARVWFGSKTALLKFT